MKTKSIIVLAAAVITVSSLVAFRSANTKPAAQKEVIATPHSGGFALKD
ncbi:MAG: hypothetical protein KIT62_11930 [Cyclobacteriaceae bacterium]|nr:hypothetical protein [Cyclobacteriaceae bacterium]